MQRLSSLRQGRFRLVCCGLLTTIVALLFLFYPPELLRFFDYRTFDLLLSGAPTQKINHRPVVVAIDEQSIAHFGQWPWPRYRLAQLVDALRLQGVSAIGIDLLMPEEDRTSPDVILRERQRDLNEERSLGRGGQLGPSNDEILAAAIASAPVVLGFKFLTAAESSAAQQISLGPNVGIVVRNERAGQFPLLEPAGVLSNLDLLTGAAAKTAFTNAAPDRDGVVRRLPMIQQYRGLYYPNLALATVQKALGEDRARLDVLAQEAILSWNDNLIPLDRRGNMLIGFSSTAPFRYVSATELLLGTMPPDDLAGQVVFIGAVAAGLGDRHVAPLDRDLAGVKIHAVVAANLLNRQWYSHPVWARGAELFSIVLFGGLSTWLLSCYNLRFPLLLILFAVVGISWGSVGLFHAERYFVSPTLPVLVLLANAALLGLLRYGVAANHLRHRNRDLLQAQDATIVSLTTLAETRDSNTGTHILRTQRFVHVLATQLHKESAYSSDISAEDVEMLFLSAPLHDIGKVGIPDKILLKTGTLTDEEIKIMREHPQLGAMALARTAAALGDPENYAYLHYARQMAETHHERWDGSGYPFGLEGQGIPLAGRLMALADVYDALVSDRDYKETSSHEEAREYIVSMSGQLFDPEIVAAFVGCEDVFFQITKEYRDELLS